MGKLVDKAPRQQWRTDPQYEVWRKAVLRNANYRCEVTGRKTRLHCHHIEGGTHNPELRFSAANGVAITPKLHKHYHSWHGQYKPATKESWRKFVKLYKAGALPYSRRGRKALRWAALAAGGAVVLSLLIVIGLH
jgi:hypothetical protein